MPQCVKERLELLAAKHETPADLQHPLEIAHFYMGKAAELLIAKPTEARECYNVAMELAHP